MNPYACLYSCNPFPFYRPNGNSLSFIAFTHGLDRAIGVLGALPKEMTPLEQRLVTDQDM